MVVLESHPGIIETCGFNSILRRPNGGAALASPLELDVSAVFRPPSVSQIPN